MAKPPKEPVYDTTIKLRVWSVDLARWEGAAQRRRTGLSAWLRDAAQEKLERDAPAEYPKKGKR